MTRDTGTGFVEEIRMKDFDFGYFGTGDEGYAQYMTAFERSFGSQDHSDAAEDYDADCDADDSEGDF